jgi:hypothetical protein
MIQRDKQQLMNLITIITIPVTLTILITKLNFSTPNSIFLSFVVLAYIYFKFRQ